MLRSLPLLFLIQASFPGQTQESAAAITYTRSVSIPLNAVQLFDKVAEAWTWTFGKEPGAKLLMKDRDQGVIEATARVNFRSEMLTLRDESAGSVQYHVTFQVRAGECRTVVTELTHTGNRNTARGGIDLGLLTRAQGPDHKIPGMGRSNVYRLYADVKQQADTRINALMQAFESRLRASVEP
ncbi:MAG: hypothetical protein ABI432_13745 [Flavobacteriales bacterium]